MARRKYAPLHLPAVLVDVDAQVSAPAVERYMGDFEINTHEHHHVPPPLVAAKGINDDISDVLIPLSFELFLVGDFAMRFSLLDTMPSINPLKTLHGALHCVK